MLFYRQQGLWEWLEVESGRAMRILLVEDERKLCDLIARALEAEGYAVAVALDGKTGWDMADAYVYGLIILDRGVGHADRTDPYGTRCRLRSD